jgi:hypothetical protein
MVRFHLKKLNNVEGTENYKVQFSNSFAASENLQDNLDINRVYKSIKREYKNFR